ncbi:MAG: hypothetical protein HFH23_09415 [Ruminococcus sp.]|nr:hypothetical protein [Ruminococcus sp.]
MAYENDLKEQFYRAAESGMVRHMPPMYKDVVVERREGRGANGTEKVWMVANVPGRKLALAFRADMWYEGHADEIRRDMDAAVGTFAKACMAEMWDGGELLQKTERDIERMTWDYGAVKPRLGMRLYGLEGNREYLEGYPHKEWGDFAVAYHVRMEDGDCMVTNEMARRLGVTLEEIHADAMAAERARCRLHEVAEIMGLVGGDARDNRAWTNLLERGASGERREMDVYVLTNKEGRYGAAAILQEEVMEKTAEIAGGDLVLFPASVDEWMVAPARIFEGTGTELEWMRDMVLKINGERVEPEKRLPAVVMYYDAARKKLERYAERVERW